MGELEGIDPSLQAAYRLCRNLNAQHGKTYFLATRLLPASKRAGVHALYGFARMVDDVVDVGAGTHVTPTDRAAADALDDLETRVRSALDGRLSGQTESDLVLRALADTTARYDIPHDHHFAFLHSMRMDVPGTPPMFRSRYRTMSELSEYMYGSASVIGLQMLPILHICSVRRRRRTGSRTRRSVPADEFHPRHGRGPGPRPDLSSDPRTRGVRRRRGSSPALSRNRQDRHPIGTGTGPSRRPHQIGIPHRGTGHPPHARPCRTPGDPHRVRSVCRHLAGSGRRGGTACSTSGPSSPGDADSPSRCRNS